MRPKILKLVESHAMETVLEQAKSQYDLVVIDTPPLTAVSDAFCILARVSHRILRLVVGLIVGECATWESS